jgi:hypothetical protein
MKRPDKEDPRFWSDPENKDGVKITYFNHIMYENELNSYIDCIEEKARAEIIMFLNEKNTPPNYKLCLSFSVFGIEYDNRKRKWIQNLKE